MAIYMKFPGCDGDVTESGHTNWIELHGFQWGVGRGISSVVGSSAERESTAPSISEVTVTKENDVSTGKLMQEALSGHGQEVQIDFTRTFKDQQDIYLTLMLTNTIISSYTHNSSGDRPMESLALNFTQVQFTTQQMSRDGTTGSPAHVPYTLATAKPS